MQSGFKKSLGHSFTQIFRRLLALKPAGKSVWYGVLNKF